MTTVSTLGSHCALQLLKGAKDEGLNSLIITKKSRESLYRRFPFIDNYILVDEFKEIIKLEIQSQLKDSESVLIPHGTLISEVGIEKVEKDLNVPVFGNKWILRWESDRYLKEKLMKAAGLRSLRSFKPEEIDRLCIVKLPGAAGGKGYFIVSSYDEFRKIVDDLISSGSVLPGSEEDFYIQEYSVGVPVYFQYFYSPITKNLELLGIDRRYETSADAFGRIPSKHQLASNISPTYVVVGNIPLVLRESLLEEAFNIGEQFVKAAEKLVPPGMIGPFCIEGVYDKDGLFIPFEFSARIVAGTNLYLNGSPYSTMLYNEPMSMGRRISREINLAKKKDILHKILT